MRWVDYRIAERRQGCKGHEVRLSDWVDEGREMRADRFPNEFGKIAYAGFYLEATVNDLWRHHDPKDALWKTYAVGHYKHARDRFLNLWLNEDRSIAYDPFIDISLATGDVHSFYYGEAARSEFRLYLQAKWKERGDGWPRVDNTPTV